MSMHDEEYKNLLKNVEDVPVSDRFLVEVNERIEADSFFKRMVRKLFFPLHIKIPVEVFGIVVTAGLLFFVLQPYYMNMEMKEQQQAKQKYIEGKKAVHSTADSGEKKKVPEVKLEESKPKNPVHKKKTLAKVKRTVKQSEQVQAMKPAATPKPLAPITPQRHASAVKMDKAGDKIKISDDELQLMKSKVSESAAFEKEVAVENAAVEKKIAGSAAAGTVTSADMDERAVKLGQMKEIRSRKSKLLKKRVLTKPEDSREVHRIRLKTGKSKEIKRQIENLITKYEGTFTRMTQKSYKVIMLENNLKSFKKDLQTLGIISEKKPYIFRSAHQSMAFELILTD